MNYEQKYKSALNWMASLYPGLHGNTKEEAEKFFPELKESDDESIRLKLIRLVSSSYNCLYPYTPTKEEYEEMTAWLEKQESVKEIVERCKTSWYNQGKIAGMAEGLTDDEKYQQGWHDALEKQGEQKPLDYEHLTIVQKDFASKSAIENKDISEFKADDWYVSKVDGKIHNIYHSDKPEPKFKVGDWITNKGHSYLIASIDYEQGRYLFEIGGYTHEQLNWEYIYSADEKYHLWTIADAKPGDVLISQYNKPFIYNGNHNHSHIGFYCGISVEDRINVSSIRCCCWTENVNIHPATKEQRDYLFKKMEEAGYEWDNENKELKKIEAERR